MARTYRADHHALGTMNSLGQCKGPRGVRRDIACGFPFRNVPRPLFVLVLHAVYCTFNTVTVPPTGALVRENEGCSVVQDWPHMQGTTRKFEILYAGPTKVNSTLHIYIIQYLLRYFEFLGRPNLRELPFGQ